MLLLLVTVLQMVILYTNDLATLRNIFLLLTINLESGIAASAKVSTFYCKGKRIVVILILFTTVEVKMRYDFSFSTI